MIGDTYKIDENKIKKIIPGVDKKIFIPDSSVEKENIILSIGRIQKQKGQIQTLEFLNNFKKIEKDFKCYFIGGPSAKNGNEYLNELKQSVEEINLNTYV